MPLPEGFNEFENLQDLVRKEHNKAVKAWFKNQPDDDISTPKSRLKHSCLIKDDDSAMMLLMRQWLFEVTTGHAQAIQAPVYGIPVQEFQPDRKFKPQIKLFFRESWSQENEDLKITPAEGEITFRLMNQSSETINRLEAEKLAKEIKTYFATPAFIWEKGWYKCTYLDDEKGYDLRLFVKSKAEGERVCQQVLKIQNHTFDSNNFQFVDHSRTYPINPGTHKVYGKTITKPRRRRRADVRFRHAQLLIWGQPNPVNLVAVGGRLRSVIERV